MGPKGEKVLTTRRSSGLGITNGQLVFVQMGSVLRFSKQRLHTLFPKGKLTETGNKYTDVFPRLSATHLSRAVVLNEGCGDGMAEGIPCLGYHILPHEKSQVH